MMKAKLITAGLFFAVAGVALAGEPMVLSKSQMDSVTAGFKQGSEGDVQGTRPGFTDLGGQQQFIVLSNNSDHIAGIQQAVDKLKQLSSGRTDN